tara:strand:- start:206 stop:676 length:471 start_codon:yes stop_codon:yes gene_type:complete
MAHYAFLNSDNEVVEVITGKDENDTTDLPSNYKSWEEYYEAQRTGLTCKRTSYNTYDDVYQDQSTGEAHADQSKKFRGNYAAIGGKYDASKDVFLPRKPHDSWVFDSTIGNLGQWKAPVNEPTIEDNQTLQWNEDTTTWDIYEWNSKTHIWELIEE